MDNNAKELIQRSDKLFSDRQDLESLWQELALNFYPERADFTDEIPLGDEFAEHLFDSFPVLARRDLGNSFGAMLRPRGKPWFKLTVDREDVANDTEAMRWLDYATGVMRRAIYDRRSQFLRATKSADHDFAAFGNAVIFLDELPTRDGMIFSNFHLRDCAWQENFHGDVDLMYRKACISARKLKQRFKKVNKEIDRCCEKEPGKEFDIIHCMVPAEDYEYVTKKKPNTSKLPYVSVFIDKTHNEILEESPMDSFRYIVPRWEILSGTMYGFSPAAMCAVADARQLQSMMRVLIEAGEKRVDPPIIATGGETVLSEVNLHAGGITWVDREYDERVGASIRALELGKNVELGVDMMVRTQNMLARAFFLNKITLPRDNKERTAYETAQLVEEFIREALPLFEPMEREYNAIMLDEVFGFLSRRGAFGPPETMPEILRGVAAEYLFSNPLQDSIERNKINYFIGATQVTGQAAAIDPSAPDYFVVDRALPDAIKGTGAPAQWIATDEEVMQRRQVRQQQQQQQAMMAQLAQAGAAAGEIGDGVGKVADASTKISEAFNPEAKSAA